MSYVRIWVHLVFSTKRREQLLPRNVRLQVQRHIMVYCTRQRIFLQAINGHTDHLHFLLSLGREQTIANVARLIKGESSFWINTQQLIPQKFAWQDDYFAISVSESNMQAVAAYIKNQEQHHAKQSFDEEMKYLPKPDNTCNRTTVV